MTLCCCSILKAYPLCALQINEEFKRITTVSLESSFMNALDVCTPKLMTLTEIKGRAAGQNIGRIKDMLLEV